MMHPTTRFLHPHAEHRSVDTSGGSFDAYAVRPGADVDDWLFVVLVPPRAPAWLYCNASAPGMTAEELIDEAVHAYEEHSSEIRDLALRST